MRAGAVTLLGSLLVLATAGACGLTVTGTAADDVSAAEPAARAATASGSAEGAASASPADGEPATPLLPLPPASCADAAGCDGADAAAAPPPDPPRGLACKDNAGCQGEDRCCYDDHTRTAACKKDCAGNSVNLCTLAHGCGEDSFCAIFIGGPSPTIGRCVKER